LDDIIDDEYDLLSFAELREFLSEKELDKVSERLEKKENIIEIIKESQEEYEPKYGYDRSKWPKEVLEEIKKELDVQF